jgi:signal peptidase II
VQGARRKVGAALNARARSTLTDPTFWSVWIVALFVIALDRVTKAWAVAELAHVHTRPWIDDWVRLTYVRNTGVAFGLGAGRGLPFAAVTLIALGLVIMLALQSRSRTWARSLALGLILGGAAGNLIDRLRWGSVLDFIDFGYRTNWWPVFNAADSAITVGVIAFAATLVFGKQDPHESHAPAHDLRGGDAPAP